jgi:hypothetical protein
MDGDRSVTGIKNVTIDEPLVCLEIVACNKI